MLNLKNANFIVVVLIALSLFFLTKLLVSNTPMTYIPHELESRILTEELIKEFNNEESLFFMFESENAFESKFLSKLSRFVNEIKSFDKTKDIGSIFDYEAIRATDEGFQIRPIISSDDPENSSFDQVSESVSVDHFVKDFFVSKDIKVFGVLVEPKDIQTSFERKFYEEKVLQSLKKHELENALVAYGGEFAVDTAQFDELNNIMLVLAPLTLLIGIALLFLLFNSLGAVALGAGFNLLAAIVTMSFFGVFGWPFNLIGSMIPTLMMALSTAFTVHLYNGILLPKTPELSMRKP
ncbi:MAG: hypothetical protein R2827_05430 [Bdellovibrionales bacterium]